VQKTTAQCCRLLEVICWNETAMAQPGPEVRVGIGGLGDGSHPAGSRGGARAVTRRQIYDNN